MGVKVYVDGTVYDRDSARISIFDRGFLYGDSVYEVMRTSGGNPVDLEAHIDRLARSAASIALDLPDLDTIVAATSNTLRAAQNRESYLRVVVTRGAGEIGLDTELADQPSLIVIVRPLELPPERLYTRGMSLWIVGVQRTPRRAVDPSVKSGNYLNNIMALHEARRNGADEALMCDAKGRVAEGSTCNVFVVQGDEVITPALEIGLLPGITRQRVIELAGRAGIDVREGTLTPDQVRSVKEAFVTSSVRGVVPVATIDGRATHTPAVGPITQRIMELYRNYLADQAHNGESGHPSRR